MMSASERIVTPMCRWRSRPQHQQRTFTSRRKGCELTFNGRQRRGAPCGSVADQRGKHEIKGCRQFDPAPVGGWARRGGHKCVRRILKEGSNNGATAPADEHQLAIGGLPLSEDRLFRRKAAGRIIGS
jgi:hypothetical protein